LLISCIFGWIVNVWVGIIITIFLAFWVVSIVGMRIIVYKDKIEYKVGFFLKTFSKSMPIDKACTITYTSDIFGKIFNYGDIIIGAYNHLDGFKLKGVKNAKMLCENVKALMYGKEK
jgi:hypothetical protein